MLKNVSIVWTIFIALLITSIIPLGFIAINAVETAESALYAEQDQRLLALVQARAAEIGHNFKQLEPPTQTAATEAQRLLTEQILSEAEVNTRLQKYGRDDNCNAGSLSCGTYGLQAWQTQNSGNLRLSNVFLNQNTTLNSELAYIIAETEGLDPIWDIIERSSPNTQRLYLTTIHGLLRIFPGHSNDYGSDWDPREGIFYTAATLPNDPERLGVWTEPYIDCAGTGLMVTYSVPIYQENNLLGVMSHDLIIQNLRHQILNFKVGNQGYTFLLDDMGHVVAHPDGKYDPPSNAPCATPLTIQLEETEIINLINHPEAKASRYRDQNDVEWLLTSSKIPGINWNLVMMQPLSEIVGPVVFVRNQIAFIAIGTVILVLFVSYWLTQSITSPLLRLSKAASAVQAGENLIPRRLVDITEGNNEISQLATIFSDTVLSLQQRATELDSIYTMGQTITSSLEPEKTLQTILAAVKQVVEFDAAEISILRSKHLVVQAWAGEEKFKNTTGQKYRVGQGLTGQIGKTKAPIFMPTISNNKDDIRLTLGYNLVLAELPKRSNKIELRSFLGVPLLIRDRLIGALTLVHHQANKFTENDLQQLTNLMGQAAIALDNALRVRQREAFLQAKIKELRMAIDQDRVIAQVKEVTETEYFRDLQANAAKIRNRRKRKTENKDHDKNLGQI